MAGAERIAKNFRKRIRRDAPATFDAIVVYVNILEFGWQTSALYKENKELAKEIKRKI